MRTPLIASSRARVRWRIRCTCSGWSGPSEWSIGRTDHPGAT